MALDLSIAGRRIGQGRPCFIIAEAGVNHNGDINLALQLIDVAAEAGADAVKFQTFDADRLATRSAPKAQYQAETTGKTESQYDMLKRLELSWSDYRMLFDRCQEKGIIFLSTPFDEQSVDLLESLGVCAYKTPSGELTNLPYLAHISRLGKPMIVSTGMATLGEVDAAVDVVSSNGCRALALLHCVSNYPAAPSDVNLRAMETMSMAFGVPIGYSDHTDGSAITLAAVARGAAIIEKHFTLDRLLPGPDHRASIEPEELVRLVKEIRSVESALGDGRKVPAASERDTALVARKSLVLARDIQAGEAISTDALTALRPGTGLPPFLASAVAGRRARFDMSAGTVIQWEMLH